MINKLKFNFSQTKSQLQNILEAESEDRESSQKIPQDIANKIIEKIQNLPCPQIWQEEIGAQLTEALKKWRSQAEAPNSLVLINSPVTSVDPILKTVINNLPTELDNIIKIKALNWSNRLEKFNAIKEQLISDLQLEPDDLENSVPDNLESRQKLVVISHLEWCFLRCIGGLEAIESLRDLIYGDDCHFWLIACNNWAWKYLDLIYQVSAYFGEKINVPRLTGEQLQSWLEEIVTELNIVYNEELGDEELDKYQEKYWENIANLSLGIDTVAVDIWLRSLQKKNHDSEAESQSLQLQLAKAKLPDLPDLSHDNLYLLYSLLLHGSMSLSHLAYSLGEQQSTVKAKVQFLVKQGIVIREQNLLKVKPSYYSKLKISLANNNFLIGE